MVTKLLLLAVVSVYCFTPTLAFLGAASASNASLQPHSYSRSQNTLQQRMMNQQSTSQPSNGDSTATSAKGSSSGVDLFPPSSKYHHDQHGLSRRRRWLVVDFDGTCTEHDTTPLLPRLAAFAAARQRSSFSAAAAASSKESNGDDKSATNVVGASDEKGTISSIHKQDLERRLSQFQILEDEFMRLFGEAKSNLLSKNEANGEGGGEDAAAAEKSMHDILDALDEPSNTVTQMVSESKVLEGLGHVDATELAKGLQLHGVSITADDEGAESVEGQRGLEAGEMNGDTTNNKTDEDFDKVVVKLRHGCEKTLVRILSDGKTTNNESDEPPTTCKGWSLAVLSINWCPALIDATLVQPVLRKRRSDLSINSCETEIPIWSNHVNGDGYVTLHVPGALAKRDRIMELRKQIHQKEEDDVSGGSSVIVYVGDSSTDLAALLEADIGIVIGQSSSMMSIAEQGGIQIVPSGHRSQHGFGSNSVDGVDIWGKKKILWRVDTWQEIDEMLIEIDEYWS